MFGYVNVNKDELKIKDYNTFRAYYCGLCRAIGKRSQTARLALSYDMTFLAVLLSSISDEDTRFEMKRCGVHPLTKRKNAVGDAAVEYAADMSILLDYLKLDDDVKDDKSIKGFIGTLVLRRSYKRVSKKYPRESGEICRLLAKLSELEKIGCTSIDETADCFAKILEVLFTPDFVTDEGERRILSWLGYNIGRWIYIIDAFADYDKDEKSSSYNALVLSEKTKEQWCEDLAVTLTYTLSEAASAYELLKIRKNDDILRNIIYLGLRDRQAIILLGKGQTNESV